MQQRQIQCSPSQYTLSQLFELSGAWLTWMHQREYRVDQGTQGYYYHDEYHLILSRGKQKASLGSISLTKKLFGPTQFDFLKELRRQLDQLYGNTDEFNRWNELYMQIHGSPGTRPEFERLVSLYVVCKRVLGYWFPLLRLAPDDIPSSPSIPGDEWERMKRAKQTTVENFLSSATFTQLVHLLVEAHHRGTLPRLIIFGDENDSYLEKELLSTHPELSDQILEIPLLEAGFPPQVIEEHDDLNLVQSLEKCVDQQSSSIVRIIQERIGSRSRQDEDFD